MQTRDLVNLFRWSKICILASTLPREEDTPPTREAAKEMPKKILMSLKWKQAKRQILMKYITSFTSLIYNIITLIMSATAG